MYQRGFPIYHSHLLMQKVDFDTPHIWLCRLNSWHNISQHAAFRHGVIYTQRCLHQAFFDRHCHAFGTLLSTQGAERTRVWVRHSPWGFPGLSRSLPVLKGHQSAGDQFLWTVGFQSWEADWGRLSSGIIIQNAVVPCYIFFGPGMKKGMRMSK